MLAGVTINEIPEDETAAQLQKLTVNVELIGTLGNSYPEVKNFLSDLEKNLRIFDVNAVYFSPDSNTYSVNLFTYYYPQ